MQDALLVPPVIVALIRLSVQVVKAIKFVPLLQNRNRSNIALRLKEMPSLMNVLKSTEVDILADSALDYSDELLRELDYTVCSIHSHFAFEREKQTERILRALA